MNKTCSMCKLMKPFSEFGDNKCKPDGKQGYCYECRRIWGNRYYQKSPERRKQVARSMEERRGRNYRYLLEYLRTHPCVECGEDDPIVLDFDHVRGKKTKEVTILAKNGHSTESIDREIGKCQILCVKCHRRKTARENGHYRYLNG